jgi:Tol biopolymer transport system component/DNA-binding winged helix-turn-helix (wHTH) protein
VYCFGEYEVDSARRLFFRSGKRIPLTPKAFDVLLALVQHRGETVSKDELLRTVWPDTVVEEISLTKNISVLRKVFGEKPGEHSYIATVPGSGYRFVATVHTAELPNPQGAQLEVAARRQSSRNVWAGSVAAVLTAAIVFWLWLPRPSPPRLWRSTPFTSFPGFELTPSLSPEGARVAFTWNGENQNNFDIYVQSVGSSAPLRLTRNSAADMGPAWSPDGRNLAFLRLNPAGRQDILVMTSVGSAERKIGETLCEFRFHQPSLAWSPDGRWLVVSHRELDDIKEGLFLVSIKTGEKRRLTRPPAGWWGDFRPSFSADGRSLVFVRLSGYSAGALYLQALSRDLHPTGEPLPLTGGEHWLTSPVWLRDGHRIAYVLAERLRARHEVRLIPISDPRRAVPIQVEPEVAELALGEHLIYVRETQDSNIWRTEIRAPGRELAAPQTFISSTRYDYQPRYSPDGRKTAFLSTRSGSQEVWAADADGRNASQLTTFGGPLVGGLAWSPDGARLLFHVRVEGRASLFTVAVSGGPSVRLTRDSEDHMPSYSHDGRWIYFSKGSGRVEIWRMPAQGGPATPLLRSNGGVMPMESSDGKTLYYCHEPPDRGIWKVPVEGGEAEPVIRFAPAVEPLCGFALGAKGLYYAQADSHSIQFVDFSTRRSRPVATSDRPIGGGFGMSVSPDERFLLFVRRDQDGSDLYIIENFVAPKR